MLLSQNRHPQDNGSLCGDELRRGPSLTL